MALSTNEMKRLEIVALRVGSIFAALYFPVIGLIRCSGPSYQLSRQIGERTACSKSSLYR